MELTAGGREKPNRYNAIHYVTVTRLCSARTAQQFEHLWHSLRKSARPPTSGRQKSNCITMMLALRPQPAAAVALRRIAPRIACVELCAARRPLSHHSQQQQQSRQPTQQHQQHRPQRHPEPRGGSHHDSRRPGQSDRRDAEEDEDDGEDRDVDGDLLRLVKSFPMQREVLKAGIDLREYRHVCSCIAGWIAC